jgi:transposase
MQFDDNFEIKTFIEDNLDLKDDLLYVQGVNIDHGKQIVTALIDYRRATKFTCPICGQLQLPVHDRLFKTWRLNDIVLYKLYIQFRVPRIKCPLCGIHMLHIPWVHHESAFTISFEQEIIDLAINQPIKTVSQKLDEYDGKIWRVILFYTKQFFIQEDWYNVTKIGIDETSSKKGHNYITVFIDLATRRILYAAIGKDSSTIDAFVREMANHNANPGQIKEVKMDMSKAFISGVKTHFINASITFDKFHVMQLINKAVDNTRRTEVKNNPLFKGTRYLWLRNPEKLSDEQKKQLKSLSKENYKTGKAYQMKLTFSDIYKTIKDKESAKEAIKKFISWAVRSKNKHMRNVSKTLKLYLDGILSYWDSKLTNASVEAINGKIQVLKRRSKGFKNMTNFITMIYFTCGGFNFNDIKNMKIVEIPMDEDNIYEKELSKPPVLAHFHW